MVFLPSPFDTLPFHRLSYDHPSPVHLLPNLTQHVAGRLASDQPGLQLWTKREDQAGPLTCYGNKYRKFEYIIPDILASKDVTIIVSEGAVQSNHTVQVASMARLLGLKCHLLLHRGIGGLRKAENKAAFTTVGNVQLSRILDAEVCMTDESDTGDEKGPLLPVLEELRAKDEVPYWIPSGASLHPLGGLGYARCAFEIAVQERQLANENRLLHSNRFDYIFVACGSGSTLAGLIAGFKLMDKTSDDPTLTLPRRIIGIMTSPTKSKSYQEERILQLARTTGKLIGLDPMIDLTHDDVHLDDRFTGEAYGILDLETAKTIDFAARADSLLLDPVYTAKVMRGMLEWAAERPNSYHMNSQNVLFIHTGGTGALSAYADFWSVSG